MAADAVGENAREYITVLLSLIALIVSSRLTA